MLSFDGCEDPPKNKTERHGLRESCSPVLLRCWRPLGDSSVSPTVGGITVMFRYSSPDQGDNFSYICSAHIRSAEQRSQETQLGGVCFPQVVRAVSAARRSRPLTASTGASTSSHGGSCQRTRAPPETRRRLAPRDQGEVGLQEVIFPDY